MLTVTLAALLLAPPASSPAGISARWESARASMERLDFKAALPVLQELVEIPQIQPGPRAEMIVALAITWLNLNKPEKAEETLARAFAWDPSVSLPQRFATPRLQQLFDAQKRAATPAVEAPKPVAPPKPIALAPPVVSPEPIAVAPVEVAQPATLPADAPSVIPWGPVLGCAAASVASLAVGALLANRSQTIASTLEATPHPRTEIARLQGERQTMAAGSIVAYSVAGAAGVAAVVIAIAGAKQEPIALTPWAMPGAAGVVLTLHSK
jgi:hypothetical protein